MSTTPTVDIVDITTRPGYHDEYGADLVVLDVRHEDGRVQHLGIGSCAAYGLRENLLQTLSVGIIEDEDEDDDPWG